MNKLEKIKKKNEDSSKTNIGNKKDDNHNINRRSMSLMNKND